MDLPDKYFNLLNEYYSNPKRPFSNWNFVYNCLDFFYNMPRNSLSQKNKDYLMLGIFFSFIHFNASIYNNFEMSAYEAIEMLDRLGIDETNLKYIFSHIVSLDYGLIYDGEKNFSYHLFRDSCFFWLYNEASEYSKCLSFLKQEANLPENEWIDTRKNFITVGLLSKSLMHTEAYYHDDPTTGKIHCLIENNLLDELSSFSEKNSSLA